MLLFFIIKHTYLNYLDLLLVHVLSSKIKLFWAVHIFLKNKSTIIILLKYMFNFYPPNSGPKNLKKFRPKKTREIKKINFTKNVFDQVPFFAISEMAKNQFLNCQI